MEKNAMYFEVNKSKIYQQAYKPSSNITRFLKSLISVIVTGQSPITSSPVYHSRKLK